MTKYAQTPTCARVCLKGSSYTHTHTDFFGLKGLMAICRSGLYPIFHNVHTHHIHPVLIVTKQGFIPNTLLKSVSNKQPGCIQRC